MEKMIFDAHAHYNDIKFDDDRESVLNSLPDKGVLAAVNNGTDYKSSLESIKYAEKYEYIYAAAGIHPETVPEIDITIIDDYIEQIAQLAQHKKVVAIGETGLDYYWDIPKEPQHLLFEKQLQLAASINKPIIIHDREAHADTLGYIKKYCPTGLLHCYSGSVEMLKEIFRYGDMCISLGGVVTYKNARVPVEVAKEVPINKLLLETDAPYLTPVPFRGKRNDSSLIMYTAQRIAEIRGMTLDDVLKYTKENACRFYGVEYK